MKLPDWHSRADEQLLKLNECYDNHSYHLMLDWLQALYEREKENIVMSEDIETIQMHWIKAKGVKELLSQLIREGD